MFKDVLLFVSLSDPHEDDAGGHVQTPDRPGDAHVHMNVPQDAGCDWFSSWPVTGRRLPRPFLSLCFDFSLSLSYWLQLFIIPLSVLNMQQPSYWRETLFFSIFPAGETVCVWLCVYTYIHCLFNLFVLSVLSRVSLCGRMEWVHLKLVFLYSRNAILKLYTLYTFIFFSVYLFVM